MSRTEPKAGEWLRQQIEELGALRNASVRDPQFKAWRQNTLTFIQRSWPGDSPKSERFRRIPFSPASTRADARQSREQFERGCGEALQYINSLLVALGEERVAPGTTRSVPIATDAFESAYPVVELGADAAPDADAGSEGSAPLTLSEGMMGEAAELDLPGSATAEPAPRSTGPSRLPSSAIHCIQPEGLPEDFAGATPLDGPGANASDSPSQAPAAKSRISVRGSSSQPPAASKEPRVNPLKDILAPHRKAEPTAARSPKAGRGRKGVKNRLKDMLGLSSLETRSGVPPAVSAPASEPASEPAMTVAPPPAKAPTPMRPPVAAERESARWTMPEFMIPGESALPLTAGDLEPAHPPSENPAKAEVWRDEAVPSEVWHDTPSAFASASVESSGAEPVAAGPADAEPAAKRAAAEPAAESAAAGPAAERADEQLCETVAADEASDTARVTAEFLKNSPVLSSMPRAAQRRGQQSAAANVQPIPSRESSASRMLAMAAEVDALGVPEGHRARARAALMDLSRHLDEPEVSWEVLREGIQFVMEFPPLARRALPLLLPFLDIAA